MTEAEWLACEDPTPMLESLATAPATRRLRLFCCACCLRASGLLTADYVRHARNALAVFERHLEGQASHRDLEGVWDRVYGDAMSAGHAIAHPGEADYYTVSAAADAVDFIRRNDIARAVGFAADAVAYDALARSGSQALARITSEWTPRKRSPGFSRERWDRNEEDVRRLPEYTRARAAERRTQCVLLRDIFGNPFLPVTFSDSWRTGTAVSLARTMYDARDFGAMPILADALQDAGCDSEDILSHCRDASATHVRGCWVVDLVLGKG